MEKVTKRLREELDTFPETVMITVQRNDLEKAVHELEWQPEEWSNQSCIGYVIKGLDDAGFEGKELEQLVRYIQRTFDDTSLEQAADIYRQSRY